MRGSRGGFALALLFAFLVVIGVPGITVAQDMPPILAPLATAPATPVVAPTITPKPESASPSAEAAIPPATSVVKPVEKPHVAAAAHPAAAHRDAKFAALMKHLTTAHQHAAVSHHVAETHRVAARVIEPSLPPGVPVPPPGYYGPGPYQRLVYGGPPPGLYGGWGGYRGRPPFYP